VSDLHIGLDLLFWRWDSGGPGRYAHELLRALLAAEPDARISAWVGTGAPRALRETDWGGDVRWIGVPVRSSGSPARVAYELAALGLDARRRGVDVVHGLAYASPLAAPGVARLVTILDLTWRHQPGAVTRPARCMFELLTWTGVRTADRVIAISQTAKADLVRTLGVAPERIDVTTLGVHGPVVTATAAHALRSRLDLPAGAPVVLCVAQLAANKNLEVLIRALALMPEAHVVICGRDALHRAHLEELARRLAVGDRLRITGFVDEADLEGLYAAATCLVLPSVHEGFGLPVAEAMARGLPVACSRAPALMEVAGGAALLFDPQDPADLAAQVGRLLREPATRAELRADGLRRAASLTWGETARTTLAAYRRALAERA